MFGTTKREGCPNEESTCFDANAGRADVADKDQIYWAIRFAASIYPLYARELPGKPRPPCPAIPKPPRKQYGIATSVENRGGRRLVMGSIRNHALRAPDDVVMRAAKLAAIVVLPSLCQQRSEFALKPAA